MHKNIFYYGLNLDDEQDDGLAGACRVDLAAVDCYIIYVVVPLVLAAISHWL